MTVDPKNNRISTEEQRREVRCEVCQGDPVHCKFGNCPKLAGVREWYRGKGESLGTSIFGATPPAVFVGEWGYPRVLTGPLVPSQPVLDPALLDAPEAWVGRSLADILRYRLTMVRGKAPLRVVDARRPDRNLAAMQEGVMASRPTDMEMVLEKRPNLDVLFSPRSPPTGPSAPLVKVILAENPAVPRKVDAVVGDTDVKTEVGVLELYGARVPQSHITKLLSIGLLGQGERRRLVPTEWSITATDDILGKALHREVLGLPEINEYRIFGQAGLANNVQLLLMPTPWMFEGLEAWLTGPDVYPEADHEFTRGRKRYPENLAGGYHAARLPILEYLKVQGRQAGAIAFLEVGKDWIPLGVWRFRELARAALGNPPVKVDTLPEALQELSKRLELPMDRWVARSRLLDFERRQTRLEGFGD